MAVACSMGPNRATIINRTTLPIAIRADYNGRTVLTVPACSTVTFQSDGYWHAIDPPAPAATAPADPAAVFIDANLPYGPEGGIGGDILVTSERAMSGAPGAFPSPPPCEGRPVPASPSPVPTATRERPSG